MNYKIMGGNREICFTIRILLSKLSFILLFLECFVV